LRPEEDSGAGAERRQGPLRAFNTNVIRLTERFVATHHPGTSGREAQLIVIGKKGRDHFRRRHKELAGEYINLFLRVVEYAQAREIAARVIELYEKKEVDAVYIIYNEFKSILAQRLITEKLLPLEGILPTRVEGALAVPGKEAYDSAKGGVTPPAPSGVEGSEVEGGAQPTEVDYIYEQPPAELFNRLLPRYVEVQVYRALLESAAAEQAARMTAMDNATKNASEMIDSLTLYMNKVRQAAITKEIIEVVSGAGTPGEENSQSWLQQTQDASSR
jgi:F-type H+-transporting ATPase subunit gamma